VYVIGLLFALDRKTDVLFVFIPENLRVCGQDSTGSEYGPVSGCCKLGNEHLVGNFLTS
jgi:hypothetical protein